ncbi:MAG TPA: molybdopterin cofactor-binding domain-containing protein [Candidatus Desulfaltia sp.]|nr:molybdopterin cofactor-binding domain-containing protein [Candidatus Desulfaltia sp.]
MKKDDYLKMDFYDLGPALPLSRREFIKLVGGGIVILFTVGEPSLLEAQRQRGEPLPDDFNAFLRIGEDGRVSCFTGKIEMGQGVVTSLAMMLADELEVPLDSVDMVMGDTDLCPWDAGTWGSMSTRFFGPPLKAAAAEARAVLVELASEYLKTPPSELTVEAGAIYHKSQRQKKVTYAQLTKGKKIARRLEREKVLEKPSDFSIVGIPELRRDAVEKVTGKAKYAGDLREPGMFYARILRPPAHGARLISLDTSSVRTVEGAKVVQDEEMTAVLHEDPELADQALKLIKAQWKKPEVKVDDKTIFDHLLKIAPAGETVSEGGNLAEGEKTSKTVIEKTYLDGYVAHAPIETHTALAKIEGSRITIWASTQSPFGVKDEVASTLGFEAKDVHVITPFVGGGFGGKGSNRQALEAAKLAKMAGRPVLLVWTRAEEFFYDTFRPAAVVKIKAGVTDSGAISLWDYRVYFAGERGSQHFYDIPHHRTMSYGSGWRGQPGSHPFGTGAWRAPANNTNTFARESHIEILATAAGMDPLEFRLKNLKDKKMIRVLKTAADKFGWTPARPPSGRGHGIACGIDAGTYVAHICEVEVDQKTGHVQVKRVVCAQDMGLSINPEGARIQMEGCITMGLGYALSEDIHFKGGEIFDLNFDTYEIPRFSWLPRIETVLIDDRDAAPQGGGEPAIICMGGVIANAIFDASGARVFQLPMTPERVKQALG